MTARPWTEAETQLLRRMYPDHTASEVARALGCTVRRVYCKAWSLDLSKSDAFLSGDKSRRFLRGQRSPAMVAAQFQKSMTPWNKGKKGVQCGGKQTQFKPGNRPQTWVPVGSYRVVYGNLEVKLNDDPGPNPVRWKPVHRLVWEAAHGPVPKGCICVFRPGRHTATLEEITLDRIEVITRGENAVRNHPRARHPELGRLVSIKGAITRQVNRIAREAAQRSTP